MSSTAPARHNRVLIVVDPPMGEVTCNGGRFGPRAVIGIIRATQRRVAITPRAGLNADQRAQLLAMGATCVGRVGKWVAAVPAAE